MIATRRIPGGLEQPQRSPEASCQGNPRIPGGRRFTRPALFVHADPQAHKTSTPIGLCRRGSQDPPFLHTQAPKPKHPHQPRKQVRLTMVRRERRPLPAYWHATCDDNWKTNGMTRTPACLLARTVRLDVSKGRQVENKWNDKDPCLPTGTQRATGRQQRSTSGRQVE